MKTKRTKRKNRVSSVSSYTAPTRSHSGEKTIDSVPLDREVPEEFREPVLNEMPDPLSEHSNFNTSQSQNRGDDLVEERDPYMQKPEKDTQVPPELFQKEGEKSSGSNLDDWAEAERQLRKKFNVQN